MATCSTLFDTLTTFIALTPGGQQASLAATLSVQYASGSVNYAYGFMELVGGNLVFNAVTHNISGGTVAAGTGAWTVTVAPNGEVSVNAGFRFFNFSYTASCALANGFWVGTFTQSFRGFRSVEETAIAVLSVVSSYLEIIE